jgi:hypothetical protein
VTNDEGEPWRYFDGDICGYAFDGSMFACVECNRAASDEMRYSCDEYLSSRLVRDETCAFDVGADETLDSHEERMVDGLFGVRGN